MLVHDFIDFHATRTPTAPCLIQGGITRDFATIAAESNKLANGLLSLGITPGQRVAILCENCPEHLLLLLAASKIGAVAVPLNYRLAPPELGFILRDAEAKVLIVPTTATLDLLASLGDELPNDITVLATGATSHTHWESWLAGQASNKPQVRISDDADYLQLYTSGTTGNPKGVVTSHRNAVALYTMSVTGLATRPGPGVADLVCAPNFHISGTGSVLLPIMAGGSVVLHKAFNPVDVVNDLQKYPVNTIFMVPAMIMAVLQTVPDIDKKVFPHLKQVAYGASPISTTLLQQAMNVFKCDFIQAYGMTETTGTVVTLSADDHHVALAGKPELLLSCGRPSPGVDAKIMDPAGNELPRGETGEIWIHSSSNMSGYFHLQSETAKTLTDGWVHTGDSGYMDEQGYIYLRDRIKDMVVSGGENIYPIEVENVLAKHTAVADVAVIGIPDEKFGEALLANVVLAPGATLTTDEMIQFCRNQLAGYKIPRQLKIIAAMPRNPSGKILKKELRKPYWENTGRSIA